MPQTLSQPVSIRVTQLFLASRMTSCMIGWQGIKQLFSVHGVRCRKDLQLQQNKRNNHKIVNASIHSSKKPGFGYDDIVFPNVCPISTTSFLLQPSMVMQLNYFLYFLDLLQFTGGKKNCEVKLFPESLLHWYTV